MKKSLLVSVAAILAAALVLFALSAGLSGIGSANAQKAHLTMLQTLLPGSESFTLEPTGDDETVRSAHKGENGYVIETVTYGYAGEITMLIGVSNEGRVTGLVVQDMEETFGLGAEALTDHVFLSQFLNGTGEFTVAAPGADAFSGATQDTAAAEDAQEVDAITGATVTSKAVARCVNAAIAYVTGADISSGATSWGG